MYVYVGPICDIKKYKRTSRLQCDYDNNIFADVPALISELHVFLLRRIKKNVPLDRWEKELIKFCHCYNQWHAWELEESGYARLKLSTRLAIIRVSF